MMTFDSAAARALARCHSCGRVEPGRGGALPTLSRTAAFAQTGFPTTHHRPDDWRGDSLFSGKSPAGAASGEHAERH